ncbi:MAG: hypothetical protein ACQEQY_02690 [Halobacteriota archaeon]
MSESLSGGRYYSGVTPNMDAKIARLLVPGIFVSVLGAVVMGPLGGGLGWALGIAGGAAYHRIRTLEERVAALEGRV